MKNSCVRKPCLLRDHTESVCVLCGQNEKSAMLKQVAFIYIYKPVWFKCLIGCKKVHKFIMPVTEKMVKFHSGFFLYFLFKRFSKGFYLRLLSRYIGTVQDVSRKKTGILCLQWYPRKRPLDSDISLVPSRKQVYWWRCVRTKGLHLHVFFFVYQRQYLFVIRGLIHMWRCVHVSSPVLLQRFIWIRFIGIFTDSTTWLSIQGYRDKTVGTWSRRFISIYLFVGW
jgi:hypothetical protein